MIGRELAIPPVPNGQAAPQDHSTGSVHVVRLLSTFAFAAALTIAARSDAAFTAPRDAVTTFFAHATGGVKVTGTTDELRVADQGESILITVPLAELHTGIALRDKHMREKYLETDRYPNAQLQVRRADLRIPADGATVKDVVKGALTLHGQTHDVTVPYAALRQGATLAVTGALSLDMTDYGIKQPSFVGITVAPDVVVRVRFRVTDEP